MFVIKVIIDKTLVVDLHIINIRINNIQNNMNFKFKQMKNNYSF